MPASSPPTGNFPNYADEGSGGDDTDAEVERGEKYYVSRISAHRGTKRRSFLVHWVGYEDTTWEPEGRLHGNEALDLGFRQASFKEMLLKATKTEGDS